MKTVVADVSLTVTLSESVTVEIQENLTPEEVGILLKEAARDELGAKLPGDIIIDLDEIDFEKITQDGKPLEFYDPRHIQVEYDEDFHGGDYSDVGDTEYIPLAWVDFFDGNVEKAFEHCTGYTKENIVSYNQDQYYTADGEEYEEEKDEDEDENDYMPSGFVRVESLSIEGLTVSLKLACGHTREVTYEDSAKVDEIKAAFDRDPVQHSYCMMCINGQK